MNHNPSKKVTHILLLFVSDWGSWAASDPVHRIYRRPGHERGRPRGQRKPVPLQAVEVFGRATPTPTASRGRACQVTRFAPEATTPPPLTPCPPPDTQICPPPTYTHPVCPCNTEGNTQTFSLTASFTTYTPTVIQLGLKVVT